MKSRRGRRVCAQGRVNACIGQLRDTITVKGVTYVTLCIEHSDEEAV
jgi:hypothetical protein